MIKQFAIAMTALLFATQALGDKAGPYVGLGVSSNVYRINDNDELNDAFEDERKTGWRLEGGYVWDLGKPGGFHLGVAGAYNDFGKATADAQISNCSYYYCPSTELSVEAQALSVLLVIEQQIVSWVDFVFKIGPSVVDYEVEAKSENFYYRYQYDNISESSTSGGATAVIGFTFFPTEHLALELASQGTAFVYDASDQSDVVTVSSLSLSAQYRF